MHNEGSRWLLVGSLVFPLACGGEVRRNTDQGASSTQGAIDAGTGGGDGAASVYGSSAATSDGVIAVAAANVSTTGASLGVTGGTSETTAVTVTGGVGGAGGVVGTGGAGGVAGSEGSGVGGASGAGGAAVFSCSEPRELQVAGVPAGIYSCDEGYEVREEQVTCPNLLASKGEGGAPQGNECTSHAECPGLEFCKYGDPFGTFCEAGCQTDADCEPGTICRCGDPIGQCFAADCVTTADCEAGSLCAAVVDTSCLPVYQYACLSAADQCQSDGDCIDSELGDWCTLVEGVRRCSIRRPCR